MTWDAYKDFKFDPNESKSVWGGDFGDSYKTDWNKDFTKNTEEASSKKNFGKVFLDQFKENLFGGKQGGSGSSFSGGGAYGASFNPFTADIGVISQGGGPTQYIAGKPSFWEQLGTTAANAAISAGTGALFG